MSDCPCKFSPIVQALVGKPFVWGGRGPGSYDCLGLVREFRRRAGMPVPPDFGTYAEGEVDALVDAELGLARWRITDRPTNGDVALLKAGAEPHIGVQTPWGILHTTRKRGAVIQRERQLRALGYPEIRYYRWVG